MASNFSRILWTTAALWLATGIASAEEAPIGVLLAVGDIAPCAEGTKSKAQMNAMATRDIVIEEVKRARAANIPVHVAVLGDLAYDSGERSEFECYRKLWHDPISAVLADPGKDWLPVPGNHEYKTEGARDFFAFFEDNAWIGKGAPGQGTGYYRLAFPEGAPGAWQLIGLNSNIDAGRDSAQYEHLDGFLKASTERCVLAFWHAPVFSNGRHGHDEGNEKKSNPKIQEEMLAAFELLDKRQASIVLNGHDHNYEAFLPMNASPGLDGEGVRSFIVGTGGRELRRAYKRTWNDLGDDISAKIDTKSYGVLRLDLHPDRYKWSFLAAGEDAARVKDSGEGNCVRR
jgi:hypothetical protein